ncbi:tripartite ATP-independent transporter DctP family solute receptor [Palleronia aestuarii]|uniref:Tripartite ATP-independent transporter DctP family solute receptor n=1 Tax=Palleronia aestuarii TaxID=568105 RepID=A0A2W7N827_9RHOB|nr:sialic acid TRAP transporter substrate-binding protein SiaP [Palleronia aestuarii]PZX13014.1 tripartite ATP-independent transporter DctP family solute receptor [Palleronia aestuarii]
MRTITSLVPAIAIAAGLTLAAPAQAKTLKFAHTYETSEPYHEGALWIADEIEKRTEGRYDIEVFPASSLGKEVDINEGLGLGTVDIIYTGALFVSTSYGPLAISDAPYIMRDFDHWLAYRESGLLKELSQGYEEATGNHLLSIVYHGQRHITANRPILSPEDMKGMKLRVPNAPLFHLLTDPLGANATPISFAEVYLALQQGVVEGQENPLITIRAKRFYEVQSDISLTGHIANTLLLLMSGNAWNELSEADQAIFTEVFEEAAVEITKDVRVQEAELVQWFRDQGVNVHEVDRAPFREIVLPGLTGPNAPWTQDQFDRLQALAN